MICSMLCPFAINNFWNKLSDFWFGDWVRQSYWLTHTFPMHPFSNLWRGFLMFSGGRERVHWERMGYGSNPSKAYIFHQLTFILFRQYCIFTQSGLHHCLQIFQLPCYFVRLKHQWYPLSIFFQPSIPPSFSRSWYDNYEYNLNSPEKNQRKIRE